MSESKSKSAGCFKYGCLGCLSLIALMVGLGLLFTAIQLTTDVGEPTPEQSEARHDLPEPPELPFRRDEGGDIPEILPLPDEPQAMDVSPGVLVLDLAMGEFTIRPGPAGEPLRVEADYDSNSFELREEFTQSDDGTWRYDVAFDAKGGFLGMLLRGGVEGGQNRVEITIPRGHPVQIVGTIGMGQSVVDLGGLWVSRVDLELEMGEHFLEVSEPLPFPMEEFRLDASMGDLEVRSLGEASPATVDVQHSMGELLLDLAGMWVRDSEVDVEMSMGECRIWLPKNARVKIDRASIALGERRVERRDESDLPEDAPTITLNAAHSMGELRIEN